MVANDLWEEPNETGARVDGTPRLDSFFNKDGLLLRTYSWTVKKAVGIIVLLHGLNAHVRLQFLKQNVEVVNNDEVILKDIDNYYVYKDSWIEKLNENGFSVYGIDLQGHGKSDGWNNLRANINFFDDLIYDVIQYIEKINEDISLEYKNESNMDASNMGEPYIDLSNMGEPYIDLSNMGEPYMDLSNMGASYINNEDNEKPPIYLMGLSLGGNIALRTLEILGKTSDYKKYNIKGCISLAGMISIEKLASTCSYKYRYFIVPFSKLLTCCFPTFRLPQNFNFQKFPYVNDLINYDTYRYDKWITIKFGRQILNSIKNLNNDLKHIPKDIPILFIHSVDDSACYYNGVINFYEALESENKEVHTLYDMDHVLTMEPGNEEVLNKVINWINNLDNLKENKKYIF
ncbi:lysophospholipase, putative [Plasmodium reichenowi]|uniref:Lysophospholipase, putative n=1 Tax=Plasmodium reichenowi TaxID=5854 RepID=A0A060RY48_PLARE|nr:lysophospholipase, putative [Plasmodium reichenowi]KYN98664.1 lysophospholipase, putative [Plasmodium reichenowi]CDO64427.1 lysophospholipase, putative [Plasmodium reichenowi]SOV79094.1 lysophospholipase, putative [Plasmodium reichenowi]